MYICQMRKYCLEKLLSFSHWMNLTCYCNGTLMECGIQICLYYFPSLHMSLAAFWKLLLTWWVCAYFSAVFKKTITQSLKTPLNQIKERKWSLEQAVQWSQDLGESMSWTWNCNPLFGKLHGNVHVKVHASLIPKLGEILFRGKAW